MLAKIGSFIAENPRLFLGNAMGMVATVFAFLSYQAKTPKKMLFLQTCLVLSIIISYAILGAWSGMALNIICLVRNISYSMQKVPLFRRKAWPYFMAICLGGMGVLSWQGPISLMVILALMINTVFLSLNDNKRLRISLLFTCTMVIIYDICFQAYLPILMESVSIISAVIGLIRYRGQSRISPAEEQ